MKFWEIVKNLDDNTFEVIGQSEDDTQFTSDIAEIKTKTSRDVASETHDIETNSLDHVKKALHNLSLKEHPGMYRDLRKQAGLSHY